MLTSKVPQLKNTLLLLAAFTSGIFMSPKWTIAVATWVYFIVLLRFYRNSNWKGFLFSIPVLALSAVIAQVEVIPMPIVPIATMMFVLSIINLIPFLLDKFLHQRLPGFLGTFIFPIAFTLYLYIMDAGPQGTWGNFAYTQYDFLALMQLASVTGIYGINFLICWTASCVNYIYEKRTHKEKFSQAIYAMPISLALVVLFGMIKLYTPSENVSTTRMATITMENLPIIQQMYTAETGKKIELPPRVSQADPLMSELQKGLSAFLSNPTNPKFQPVYAEMDSVFNRYLLATRKAANAGAKIITWSEAAIINIKSREAIYEAKITDLANSLDIYLFFPTGVFHPEKVGKEDKFLENKVLTFSPDGELLNTYFKNIPVMGVEPSFSGDGKIPVIETPYGNLSPIICYDADHPKLIAQISQKNTELLVVPTGDWNAISPYHTFMAAIRCIENGVSMIKATSNGLSAMIDDKGRILAQKDFFTDEKVKSIVYDMPIKKSNTVYSSTQLIFIYGLAITLILLILTALVGAFQFKNKPMRKMANL